MRIRATEAFDRKPVEIGMHAGHRFRKAGDGSWCIELCRMEGTIGPATYFREPAREDTTFHAIAKLDMKMFTEYSTDKGKTWLPIAGTARGLLPGDVLVRAGTVDPAGYVDGYRSSTGVGFINGINLRAMAQLPVNHNLTWYQNGQRVEIPWEQLDILSGPEATPILLDIIKGKYATEVK